MVTSSVEVPKYSWTFVSAVSVSFQNTGRNKIYVVEAATLPTGEPFGKVITPQRGYGFSKLDGNLYAYSVTVPASIAIDPLA